MKSRSDFEEIGLPHGHVYPKLAYHPPTGSIIVQTQLAESTLPSRRLSIRRLNEARYHPIGDFPPEISTESFVLCASSPLLFVNTFIWKEHINGPVGGDWDALYSFNLDTLQSDILVRKDELVPPDGYRSAWFSTLFSASNDGRKLFCRAGLRNQEPKKPIDYCLSEFSVADRKLAIITKLKAVFA